MYPRFLETIQAILDFLYYILKCIIDILYGFMGKHTKWLICLQSYFSLVYSGHRVLKLSYMYIVPGTS